MNARSQKIGFLVLNAFACRLDGLVRVRRRKSFTGTVSDAMCGAKHAMAGDAAACTRGCVSKGSKYALVVGDKVYTLETSDKTALATLDKQAGEKATVMGTEKDNTIMSVPSKRHSKKSTRSRQEALDRPLPLANHPALECVPSFFRV